MQNQANAVTRRELEQQQAREHNQALLDELDKGLNMLKSVTQTAQSVVSGGKQVDSAFASETSYSQPPPQKQTVERASPTSPKTSPLRNATTILESAPSGLDSLEDGIPAKLDLEEKPLTLDTISGLDAFMPDAHEEITVASPPIPTTSTATTAVVLTLEEAPKSEPVEQPQLHVETE